MAFRNLVSQVDKLEVGLRVMCNGNWLETEPSFYTGTIKSIKKVEVGGLPEELVSFIEIERDDGVEGGGVNGEWGVVVSARPKIFILGEGCVLSYHSKRIHTEDMIEVDGLQICEGCASKGEVGICSHCGERFIKALDYTSIGLCSNCRAKAKYCKYHDGFVMEEDFDEATQACKKCAKSVLICVRCGSIVAPDQIHHKLRDGGIACAKCYGEAGWTCMYCGGKFLLTSPCYVTNGMHALCINCYVERSYSCCVCNQVMIDSETVIHEHKIYCRRCLKELSAVRVPKLLATTKDCGVVVSLIKSTNKMKRKKSDPKPKYYLRVNTNDYRTAELRDTVGALDYDVSFVALNDNHPYNIFVDPATFNRLEDAFVISYPTRGEANSIYTLVDFLTPVTAQEVKVSIGGDPNIPVFGASFYLRHNEFDWLVKLIHLLFVKEDAGDVRIDHSCDNIPEPAPERVMRVDDIPIRVDDYWGQDDGFEGRSVIDRRIYDYETRNTTNASGEEVGELMTRQWVYRRQGNGSTG
jgi:hypothetical protein